MKQKIVIKVQLNSHKEKAKAMEIASISHGVTSIAIGGKEKDEVEVVGEGVDPVELTSNIRKKVSRNAKLVRVEEVKPKDDEGTKKQEDSTPLPPWSNYYHHQYSMPVYAYETVYSPNPRTCSIM